MLIETLSNFWQDTGLANVAYQNVIMIVVSFIFFIWLSGMGLSRCS